MVFPHWFLTLFSTDRGLLQVAVPALRKYLGAFFFMVFMITGQTVFKSLNCRKIAIFFSLLRKVIIILPLTWILSYGLHLGTDGVFLSEPISNIAGGMACFLTMCVLIRKKLRREFGTDGRKL
jgi:Na+-driven multidrug efflux pump